MFIFNNFSTCFGHHYAHLQENKMYVTACVVLCCNKRGKLDISFNVFFVWYCVVILWYFLSHSTNCSLCTVTET